MTKKQILDYVSYTVGNTNINVLGPMLDELVGSGNNKCVFEATGNENEFTAELVSGDVTDEEAIWEFIFNKDEENEHIISGTLIKVDDNTNALILIDDYEYGHVYEATIGTTPFTVEGIYIDDFNLDVYNQPDPILADVIIINNSGVTINVLENEIISTPNGKAIGFGRITTPVITGGTKTVKTTYAYSGEEDYGAYGFLEIDFSNTSVFANKTLSIEDGILREQLVNPYNRGWVIFVVYDEAGKTPKITISNNTQ